MTVPNRIPNDPYRTTNDINQPAATGATNSVAGRHSPLDNEWQPDLELAEGPASKSRVAVFAVAIAVVVGAVFYGLNNSSVEQAGTSSTAQTAAPPTTTAENSQPPAPPPATGAQNMAHPAATDPGGAPKANSAPGMTTGAAPAKAQTPLASAPTGQEMNRSGNPPTNPTAGSTTK